MKRFILAAAAAALISGLAGLAGLAPAQARMANPALEHTTPSAVQDVQYRHRDYRRHHHRYRHHSRRHRHCWNHRVRVYVRHGHYVWRTQRRCAWRYY
jgi:hypothetical protein